MNLTPPNQVRSRVNIRSTVEQAKRKLANHSPMNNIPLKSRRKLRRMINFASLDEITIPEEINTFINAENGGGCIVLDSGTLFHINKSKQDFLRITDTKIRMRGISGGAYGYKGYLKPSPLGLNIESIYFPQLPVNALLSVEGLKKHGWEIHFLIAGNIMRNRTTGAQIPMCTDEVTNLPSIRINYSADEEDVDKNVCFLSSPVDETPLICPPAEININNSSSPTDDNINQINSPSFSLDNNHAGISGRSGKRTREHTTKTNTQRVSKLLKHQRMGHFHDPKNKVRCLDCLEAKGRRGGASQERSEKYQNKSPFLLFSADFFGKVSPPSIRKNNWVIAFICDDCGFAHAEPIHAKRDAPEALERFTKQIRDKCGANTLGGGPREMIVGGIHTDNEPVLTGQRWKETCDRLGITELHSIPYVPQGNGTIERFVGTLKNSLRTSMRGIDSRVWDYAVTNCVEIWNMNENKKCSKSNDGILCCPNQVLSNISSNPFLQKKLDRKHYLRRFGCLAFFKPYRTPKQVEDRRNKVLLPTRLRGINLGFSPNNSAWLIGSVNESGHFATYETRDVTFCEDMLVRDIRALSIRWELDLPSHFDPSLKPNVTTGKSTIVETAKAVAGKCAEYQFEGCDSTTWVVPPGTDDAQLRSETIAILDNIGKSITSTTKLAENIRHEPEDLEIKAADAEDPLLGSEPMNKIPDEKYWSVINEKQDNIISGKEPKQYVSSVDDTPILQPDGHNIGTEVQFGPTSTIRRRGRPAGSKDLRKRHRRTKKQMCPGPNAGETKAAALLLVANEHDECYAHLAMGEDEEDGIEEVHFFLAKVGEESKPGDSVKASWAFSPNNPERPRWIEAKEKEEVRLNAYNTWRKLTDEEEIQWRRGIIKAVPTALLLTRKRCGRYKGRLVVLGNRWVPDGENNVYASVVSQVGNRATLIHAAKLGMEVIPFDIGNAFIRASMDDLKVVVTIPETFRDTDKADNGRRMLLKALYGLPVSPRLWAKCLGKDLKALGWVECINEPGVWRKHSPKGDIIGYLTVYVDDCVLCAKDLTTVEAELKLIHDKHPLTQITCTPTSKGGKQFDLTGADIEYTANSNTVKISMGNYIRKLLKKFDMMGSTPLSTPSFEEKTLYDPNAKPSEFPYKSAIGGLQWACTCARPDLAHSVNMLARAGANPCTNSMAKCVRIVFRYLVGTIDYAIEYSPENEAAYYKEYNRIATEESENASWQRDAGQAKKPLHLHCDASFGVEFKTMKSVSGIAVFLHGTIIAWRSKVQSIMTNCTTQSEWVSLSEGLEFSSTIYGLKSFLTGSSESEPLDGAIFNDNRGAALIGRKGPDGIDEIPRRSRHICLRHAAVLQEHKRLFWCPTGAMLADGLTKSSNAQALKALFSPPKPHITVDGEEDQQELSLFASPVVNSVNQFPLPLVTSYFLSCCEMGFGGSR